MNLPSRPLTILSVFLALSGSTVHAAEYQWSVPVQGVLSTETSATPRAWLWIPPQCKQVRAVIVGQHNLLEEAIFENATFRRAAAENDMAIVWVSPAFDGLFRPDLGAGQIFEAILQSLAQESGYSELASTPVVPIGHSAMAGYPYQLAAWKPERTLVAISIKGTSPDGRGPNDFNFDSTRLNGVPLLFINGEYEDAEGRAGRAARFREKYPLSPLTMVADAGGGHFDFHDRLARYMGLYLRKVARYRLPEKSPLTGPVPLKPIDPTQSGWLYDRFRRDTLPKAAPAPINAYTGPKNEAFWAFDEELAKATDAFALQYRLKKPQITGYLQNGEFQPINPKRHEGVLLKMAPQPDGVTFKLTGTFLDTVPAGGPTGWTSLAAGSPIGHSTNGVPVKLDVITGPLKKVADGTFVIQFGRIGFTNGKRSGGIWLQASHDGDETYKRAVQQAALNIPIKNTSGAPQTLTFPVIGNQPSDIKSVPLQAASNAGVPVSYYVLEGPAEVDGDTLKFTVLPPRTQWPVRVTVVAYQWGRSIEPKLQSTEPVTRTFYLLGPGQKSEDRTALYKANLNRAALWETAAEQIAALPAIATPTTKPEDFGRAISFNFAAKLGMDPAELAGDIHRVPNWNNILGFASGQTLQLRNVTESTGTTIPLSVALTGESGESPSTSVDTNADPTATQNDARLFNGAYISSGAKTTLTIFGIPYPRYDVVFYGSGDNESRAAKFHLGNRVLYLRGGKGLPYANRGEYVPSTDATCGQGKDIQQGNVVRFKNLSGNRFTATFAAAFGGHLIDSFKIAGFQIVERK